MSAEVGLCYFTLKDLEEAGAKFREVKAGKSWIYATLENGIVFKIRNWKAADSRPGPVKQKLR